MGLSLFCLFLALSVLGSVESKCPRTCPLALGSYYVWPDNNLTFISRVVNGEIPNIRSYNPQIPNQDSVISGTRVNLPFSCDCIEDGFLGHMFQYSVQTGDTYDTVAKKYYSNLTTTDLLQRFNTYDATFIPDKATINVTVNCSCGDEKVSKDYGLFITYPLRSEDNLSSIAAAANLSSDLIRRYNPNANFDAGTGLVFIPGKGESSI